MLGEQLTLCSRGEGQEGEGVIESCLYFESAAWRRWRVSGLTFRDLDRLQEEMVATGVNVEDGTGEGRKGRGSLASSESPSVYSYPEPGRLFCLWMMRQNTTS